MQIGGRKAPIPLQLIITMPYCTGLMPNWGANGSKSGPKITRAGSPSRIAPDVIKTTIEVNINIVGDPTIEVKNTAIFCGTCAIVRVQEKALAEAMISSTIPVLEAVSAKVFHNVAKLISR